LKFARTNNDRKIFRETTASLDRINNDLGYIEGNVQWVHKDVNRMKWAFTQDRFLELCCLITENINGKKVAA